jgi:hypothetical protein
MDFLHFFQVFFYYNFARYHEYRIYKSYSDTNLRLQLIGNIGIASKHMLSLPKHVILMIILEKKFVKIFHFI